MSALMVILSEFSWVPKSFAEKCFSMKNSLAFEALLMLKVVMKVVYLRLDITISNHNAFI